MAVKKAEATLDIQALDQQEITLKIIGNTPLYFNKMSAKAQRTLLAGGGRKTAAEKKLLKHDPEREFAASAYTHNNPDTLLCFPAPGIKGAMATAALETAGVTKTSVNRLLYLPEHSIRIWGSPQMKLDVVRSADMNKTPDVRTRAYLPTWCSEVKIRYIHPTLNKKSVISLLVNAGMVCGIGDFRVEKGKGAFGSFSVLLEGDPREAEWDEIKSTMGRDAQQLAMVAPQMADDDSAELLEWLREERVNRGLNPDGSSSDLAMAAE